VATKDEIRQTILEAAQRLFTRFGPVKTSVADIARELGMSPANIYNFFVSRDAIMEAVGELTVSELRRDIVAQTDKMTDEWSKVEELFLMTGRHLRFHLDNEKDILHIQALERKNEWTFIVNFHTFLIMHLEIFVRTGVAKRQFRPIDPRTAAVALFDCMMSAHEPFSMLRFAPEDHEPHLKAQLALLRRALE
jgi:AcrR family transcriptional regulator